MARREWHSTGPVVDYIGQTGPDVDVVNLTLSLDTSAYASGDLVADTQEIVGAASVAGGHVILDSIVIIDEDDQGVALNFVFSQVVTSFGTENSAPNISDANALFVCGHVAFATTDYVDIGTSKIGTKANINLPMELASGATSLFVAVVNGTGTPTFTATGLKIKFGFRRTKS